MPESRRPLPVWLAPLTWPMARFYAAAVAWRNARWNRGKGLARLAIQRSHGGAETLAPPVISIGNVTAGGTGKSPCVAWCAEVVASSGAQPVIALRGYRATRVGDSSAFISDEAAEYAWTAPMARVVVGARRHEALVAELSSLAAENWRHRAVVLLDDGFQHRQLARDLDVVLVDATRPSLDGDVLPNGWLREHARGIARADIVILTKADDSAQRAHAAALVANARGRPHDAVCVHEWRALTWIASAGSSMTMPVSALHGKKVLSACALGNPAHFHAMAMSAGANVVERLEKPDHRPFTLQELERNAARVGVRTVLLSRKDFVKLDGQASMAVDLIVPQLSIAFLEGEDRVRAAIARVLNVRNSRESA